MSNHSESYSNTNYFIRSTIAGGVAGAVAKTAVAPLDRLKILFQTHNQEFVRFSAGWKGPVQGLAHILKTQGFLGLYRGHSLTLARAVPHAALGYTFYDTVRKLLIPTERHETPFRRLIAGSLAGVSVLPVTYPFELARVRMAIETKRLQAHPSLVTVFRNIYTEPTAHRSGFFNFYRGFAVTLLGTVPYRGGIFLVWETLNAFAKRRLSPELHQANKHKIHLVVGAIAGTTSQIITYPLEVIRRMQQASGHALGFKETVGIIWKTGGWRGYYAGLGIGLVKQVPMHSISLAVWQAAKGLLNI